MTAKDLKKMLTPIKKHSTFSGPQLVIFLVAFGLIGYFLFRAFAGAPLVASLEAEQMTLPAGASQVTDASASGGKAVLLASNGTATGAINLTSPAISLTVNARGVACKGSPTMTVAIDGTNLLSNTAVSSSSWTSYSATTTLNSGTHNLSVSFNNDNTYSKRKGHTVTTCSRDLYVDVTNFYGNTPPPPPAPTVSLSVSPSSVNAGQAATLTWASTNADTCTASGAWSGTQSTSGSVSTGALNQTSVYNLSCSGAGGSATASATVTVSATTVPQPPTIYLKPLSQTFSVGSNFTVEVRENSGTRAINVAEGDFTYPANLLTFVGSDASASPFTTEAQNTGGNGTVTLARGIIGSLTGDQLISVVTFKANAAGTANLSFSSSSALVTSDTNLNILTLSNTGPGKYTLQ